MMKTLGRGRPGVRIGLLIGALALLATACVSNASGSSEGAADGSPSAPGGYIGDPGEADRTIEVVMTDQMRYEPGSITVQQGETITFVVKNAGRIMHELMLGHETLQLEHEAEMTEPGAGPHHHPNSALVSPGETGTVTWTFSEKGEVLMGCHMPGHWAAGMVGSIEVR